mgnify:CR=1 FL=1
MPIIDEKQLIYLLGNAKNVLLLEPPFKRSYVPLGLAKIASFLREKNINFEYSRNPIIGNFDLICMSTVFTTDSEIVIKTIKECQSSLILRNVPIIVGGIFASLMPEYFEEKINKKINIFTGYSKILDSYIPDYQTDWKINGFFKDAITLFTQRGCPNKCGFCMVPKMEPDFLILPKWKETIEFFKNEVFVVSDNNLLYAPKKHIEDVIAILNNQKKKVIFNNGIDCEKIDDENAKLLASLKYVRKGFRLAFDDMSQDGFYQKAMEKMEKYGLRIKGQSLTYVLFNFNDTPQDAYYRVQECWKYGSLPYPMKYRPLNQLTKRNSYIGKYWTENLVKAFHSYITLFGYNSRNSIFESWIKNNKKFNSRLSSDDWDKWNFKK